MTKIFLSYRRGDSAATVGRIYDRLTAQFGEDAVFKDVHSIAPAEDFMAAIESAIESSGVVLAVMGRDWRGPEGQSSRLDQPGDFVRLELEIALRKSVPVIPILVDGAAVPQPDTLPESLRELPFRNGLPVRPDPDFHRDMDGVVRACRRLAGSRSRHGSYWIAAAIAALLAGVVIWNLRSAWLASPAPDVAVDVTASVDWGAPRMAEQGIPRDRVVDYRSRLLEGGVSHITYELAYGERAGAGEPVRGLNYLGAPFKWRFPHLSVKVVNNSDQRLVLSRALIEVISSEPRNQPILTVEDLSVGGLVIRNEGWGRVIEPVVRLSVREPLAQDAVSLFAPETHTVEGETFDATLKIPIAAYVPERLQRRSFVDVSGEIEYGETQDRKRLPFGTRVSLQVRTAVGLPVSQTYQLLLRAGEAPVTEQVDIAQEIAPGQADHFTIQLGTTMSARKRIRIDVQTAEGRTLEGGEMLLDLFVPRTAGKLEQAEVEP